MIKASTALVLGFGLLASPTALAGEKTITLTVKNMYCAACPHTVKSSLEAVSGVTKAVVSYKDKTAVVTYDDAKTNANALTAATTNAGHTNYL
jgi:periplasmic mercuric ion binding protein